MRTDRKEFPAGYTLETGKEFEGLIPWTVRLGGVLLCCGIADSPETALRLAVSKAWQHWDRESPVPKPTVAPAWMVEVAREACAREAEAREWHSVAEAYREGRGDGDLQFQSAMAVLRLAIERGHVVEPREWTDEDLLKAAREDAAQANEADGNPHWATRQRMGNCDDIEVRVALQARRNMLREMGLTPVTVDRREVPQEAWRKMHSGVDLAKPGSDRTTVSAIRSTGDVAVFYLEGHACRVDLEAALKRAWDAGFIHCRRHGGERPIAEDNAAQERGVSSILSTLPAKE